MYRPLTLVVFLAFCWTALAQDATNSLVAVKAPDSEDRSHVATAVPSGFIRNLVWDQKSIWASPFKAKIEDLNWVVPVAGITAGLINGDAELSSRISTTNTFARHSRTISNAGLAITFAGSGGLYFLGRFHGDDHQREAGILTVEAMTNSLVVVEGLKLFTIRERPTTAGGLGHFWSSGSPFNSSFPSTHAALTWSAASVLTHEYPTRLTAVLAYGLAGTVSAARVASRNHFPSDVFVGSALGWFVGRQIYAAHHNEELEGGGWGTFHKSEDEELAQDQRASPYVPLDSWIYPALDRLIALGVINSGLRGLKPWTRRECARMLEEASDQSEDLPVEATRLYSSLAREFATELGGMETNYASLDSLYVRATSISGQPLTDGYHFAQTLVNDFGRPYQRGMNYISGFSASGSSGALGFYIRGEYEHAPSAPGVSQAAQNQIQVGDSKPVVVPASPIPAFNRLRLLDTYVTLNLDGWQTSFGKQSLWLGPGEDPFLSSDNAEPIYMFRIDQTSPKKLPWFMGFLGPYRSELWIGKLTGQHFVGTQDVQGIVFRLGRSLSRQPMLNGLKINFKPTPNFEFGVGRTGLWGGPDFPITLHTTRLSFFSTTNAIGRNNDPGDRRSTFDFSYRIPGLRKWLTLYEDSFVEDEISPIGYPRRAAHQPGVYLSHLPGLPHLDFRAEAAYTNLPGLIEPPGGGFFYWNVRYLDGYTNKGNIIGDATTGRQGISYRAGSTYWFSSQKSIQLGFRSNNVDSFFLRGGNFRDIYLNSKWSFSRAVSLASFVQYEHWNFPLLSAGQRKTDVTASFQITYEPHWRWISLE